MFFFVCLFVVCFAVVVCGGGLIFGVFLSGQDENGSLLSFCNDASTAFLINSSSEELTEKTFFSVLCLNLNNSNIILARIYYWVNLNMMVVMHMFLVSVFCLREPIMLAKLKSSLVLLSISTIQ